MEVFIGVENMILFVSFFVFAMLFYIGFQLYRFDNSPFAKEYGYSFFQTLVDKKIHTLKALYDQLHRTNSNAKVIFNVQIDEATHRNFADAIVIHPAGIFIVLLQPKKGWISGTDKSYEWVEQLHGGKVNAFPNPIHLTERMAFAISDLLPDVEKKQLESVILFSNDCSFQRIELSSDSVEVLKNSEINRWVSALTGQVVPNEQINNIYISLKKYSQK